MANLKEVRERIKSVINTQQITKAMKMVSAAKLRRAQGAIVQMRPYSNKLNQMLDNILANTDGATSIEYAKVREVHSVLVVVVTSNRGLCGAFNANVSKEALATIEQHDDIRKAGKLTVMCIGKKGYDFLKRRVAGLHFQNDHIALFSNLAFDNTVKVANEVMDSFTSGKYDKVVVCYAQFRNAAVQNYKAEQFLPVASLQAAPAVATNAKETQKRADYIFEPSTDAVLKQLVPSILQTQFQKFLLDSHASEHGARMTSMDKASDNANELLKELRINYNKARQESITKELLEIVAGSAALDG
jgi:F-type H+-transporting ATPase subunit gamma